MDTEELLTHRNSLRVSEHALREAHKEGVYGRDIVHAIFNGEIIERYFDRERVLIMGPATEDDLPLHIVCDYSDMDEIVVVTVYIPNRTKWVTDIRRRHA
jgi:hypothetical protein